MFKCYYVESRCIPIQDICKQMFSNYLEGALMQHFLKGRKQGPKLMNDYLISWVKQSLLPLERLQVVLSFFFFSLKVLEREVWLCFTKLFCPIVKLWLNSPTQEKNSQERFIRNILALFWQRNIFLRVNSNMCSHATHATPISSKNQPKNAIKID